MRPVSFSVVIPTGGTRQRYLEEAVASVVDQSVGAVEIIVVDDSGESLVEDVWHGRVVMVRRPDRGGAAAARNSGMASATGELLAFLDDDDRYLPERLERSATALGIADFVVCGLVGSNGRPGPNRRLVGDISDSILDDYTPQPGTVLGRRDRFPRFDESMQAVEDVEWWLRLGSAGRFTTVPSTDYWYRLHDEPRTGYGTEERLVWREELLRRHEAWFASHPRARAFQLLRMGVQARQLGRPAVARRYLAASLRAKPSAPALRQLVEVALRR